MEFLSTVLKPFATVLQDARVEGTQPSLDDLKARFAGRLLDALERANRILDDVLAERRKVPVRALKTELRGREIETEAELSELRTRIADQLRAGVRVRLE